MIQITFCVCVNQIYFCKSHDKFFKQVLLIIICFSNLVLQKIILLILEKFNKGEKSKILFGIRNFPTILFTQSLSHCAKFVLYVVHHTSIIYVVEQFINIIYQCVVVSASTIVVSAPYAYCVVYFACFQHFTCCMLKYSSNLACSIMVPTYLNSQTRYLLTSVAFWSLFFVPF